MPGTEARLPLHLVGVAIALIAGTQKAILLGTAGNDDYQHLAYARQLLSGDLPLRDFWDISTTLQEMVSAVSQILFGHRLLSEALIVGIATAIAVFLVFRLVTRLTGSAWLAIGCALLFVVAIPRAYAYPKWLVYSIAASLWWSYVWSPSARKAIFAGASVAVAFYWRHDHGVLAAIGVALSVTAAHGWRHETLSRLAVAGSVALAGALPYLLFSASMIGVRDVIQLDRATFTGEHAATHAELRWPLRSVGDYVGIKPAEWYAPEIIIRWRADLPADARAAALKKYELTLTADEDENLERVRLSARSLGMLRALIDDPQIEDTSRVDRARGTFSRDYWPLIDRALFRYPLLRLKLLPGIDLPADAGMAAALMMHAIPLLVLLLIFTPVKARLPPAVTARSLLCFASFAVLVNLALVREPYSLRSTEVLVLPATLLAVFFAAMLRPAASIGARWTARAIAAAMMVVALKSLAVAGEFPTRVLLLTNDATRRQLVSNLLASPPSRLRGQQAELPTARLADYVRRCVSRDDRILVLWYAPEIHYESDRLMAGRHLYFFTTFADDEREQQRELEKVLRFKPPIVLTSSLDAAAAQKAFPAAVRQVNSDYVTSAFFDADGARYSILTRMDRPASVTDTITGWPCYQ
jgi:hypothetical protein